MTRRAARIPLLVAVALAVALAAAPASAQGLGGLGDLLGAVNQLVGSTSTDAQAKAGIKTGGVTVDAAAGTTVESSGLSGLLHSVLGGSTSAEAGVSYGEYQAGASVQADYGLASTVNAVGSLLQGLGKALGGLLRGQ